MLEIRVFVDFESVFKDSDFEFYFGFSRIRFASWYTDSTLTLPPLDYILDHKLNRFFPLYSLSCCLTSSLPVITFLGVATDGSSSITAISADCELIYDVSVCTLHVIKVSLHYSETEKVNGRLPGKTE